MENAQGSFVKYKKFKHLKMKALMQTVVAALLLSSAAYGQTNFSTTKNQQHMEAKEITEPILKSMETGWNTANGTTFALHFDDVSDFVDIRGTLHQKVTRLYIGEAHQGLFMSIYKDSKISYSLIQAHSIDGNTIFANAKAVLDAPGGPLAGKSTSTISLVIIKSGTDWKIKAFHNTLVAKQ